MAAKWGVFLIFLWESNGATYMIDPHISQGNIVDTVPGLHVGSMLAFKANCVNVDISGIEDAHGVSSVMGELSVLVADETISPLAAEEPKHLFFLQHDGTKPLPFRENRFEWIIAEHFIEHITFLEAVDFLKECRRLLTPGGTLRLSTPDLAIYAAAFFDPAQRFFKEHYKLMTESPGMEGNKQFMSPRRADMFNQIFHGYGHQHIYDELELRTAADLAGWTPENGCEVKLAGYRQGDDVELAKLDDKGHQDESIYVELTCGATSSWVYESK